MLFFFRLKCYYTFKRCRLYNNSTANPNTQYKPIAKHDNKNCFLLSCFFFIEIFNGGQGATQS